MEVSGTAVGMDSVRVNPRPSGVFLASGPAALLSDASAAAVQGCRLYLIPGDNLALSLSLVNFVSVTHGETRLIYLPLWGRQYFPKTATPAPRPLGSAAV